MHLTPMGLLTLSATTTMDVVAPIHHTREVTLITDLLHDTLEVMDQASADMEDHPGMAHPIADTVDHFTTHMAAPLHHTMQVTHTMDLHLHTLGFTHTVDHHTFEWRPFPSLSCQA